LLACGYINVVDNIFATGWKFKNEICTVKVVIIIIIITIITMAHKILFVVLLALCMQAQCDTLQIIEFFNAGDYVVTPGDYNYSANVIVEVWGAGSGGSVRCGGVACNTNQFDYSGGMSGGYVRANVVTNMNNFTISIGKGGAACSIVGTSYYKYYDCGDNIDGTSTSISFGANSISSGSKNIVNIVNDNGYVMINYDGIGGSSGRGSDNCVESWASNSYVNDTFSVGYGGVSCTSGIGNGGDGGVRVYYASW
jgi:hypothetical protein